MKTKLSVVCSITQQKEKEILCSKDLSGLSVPKILKEFDMEYFDDYYLNKYLNSYVLREKQGYSIIKIEFIED